jgi:hypothetical protein
MASFTIVSTKSSCQSIFDNLKEKEFFESDCDSDLNDSLLDVSLEEGDLQILSDRVSSQIEPSDDLEFLINNYSEIFEGCISDMIQKKGGCDYLLKHVSLFPRAIIDKIHSEIEYEIEDLSKHEVASKFVSKFIEIYEDSNL